MTDRAHDGVPFRMLCVIHEFTRECLVIWVERKLNARIVPEVLADLFLLLSPPDHIRSDNGSELVEKALRDGLANLDFTTLSIEPDSPRKNGYSESFNSKLRDELLARKIFCTMAEAKTLIVWWRQSFNTFRPHSSRGHRPPATKAVMPKIVRPALRLR